MPISQNAEKPAKPVRIAPWRGPLHFGLLVISATISLALQFSYVLLVAGVFIWMCWQVYLITGSMARVGLFQWRMIPELLKFAFMVVTWVFMLRPLRPRPEHAKVAIQITAATQPQLFELIHMLCWHLRAQAPTQVWLDTTISVRTTMFGGLLGILTGQTMLHLGLPVVSVITARELSGLLAHELSHNAGGLSTIFVHAVRETNAWFFRAMMERDAWELRLREAPKKESEWRKQGRRVVRGWMWAAKIPFMLFAFASRAASAITLWVISRSAERCGANVIGKDMYDRMQRKLALLGTAWKAAEQEIQRGVIQHRLPENLSLLMARHVATAAKVQASARAEAGEIRPEPAAAGKLPKGAALVEYLSHLQPQ